MPSILILFYCICGGCRKKQNLNTQRQTNVGPEEIELGLQNQNSRSPIIRDPRFDRCRSWRTFKPSKTEPEPFCVTFSASTGRARIRRSQMIGKNGPLPVVSNLKKKQKAPLPPKPPQCPTVPLPVPCDSTVRTPTRKAPLPPPPTTTTTTSTTTPKVKDGFQSKELLPTRKAPLPPPPTTTTTTTTTSTTTPKVKDGFQSQELLPYTESKLI